MVCRLIVLSKKKWCFQIVKIMLCIDDQLHLRGKITYSRYTGQRKGKRKRKRKRKRKKKKEKEKEKEKEQPRKRSTSKRKILCLIPKHEKRNS